MQFYTKLLQQVLLVGDAPLDGYWYPALQQVYPMMGVGHRLQGQVRDEHGYVGESDLVVGDALMDIHGQPVLCFFNTPESLGKMVYEQGCCSCRSFDVRVGYHVENAFVTVVSYACDDGQGELGDILSKSQCVETADCWHCL